MQTTDTRTVESDGGVSLNTDGAMKVSAAVKFTGVSRAKLYELMGSGELPYTTLGRSRLIPRRALIALLDSGLIAANKSE